jgi:ADP-ribose pyrophosphatase
MWKVNNSEYIYKSRWLTVRKDSVCTDKGVNIDDFYVLEYPTWVNVVAKTEDGNYIVERQYRHGLKRDAYEICAGVCEEGEEPLSAAQRELLEETGFGGGQWSLIGKFAPNANSMNNWCYSFLAEGVTKLQDPKQEPTEDITVLQVNKKELLKLMKDGQIVEGVMLAPLWQHLYDRK